MLFIIDLKEFTFVEVFWEWHGVDDNHKKEGDGWNNKNNLIYKFEISFW